MLPMPRAGILCTHTDAAIQNTYPLWCLSFHKVCLFCFEAFGLQAREIHFWKMLYSACHVHRAPRKSIKARIPLEDLCTLKTGCEKTPETVRKYVDEQNRLRCQIISSRKIPGIRRNSNAKAYGFSPLYSYDFGL